MQVGTTAPAKILKAIVAAVEITMLGTTLPVVNIAMAPAPIKLREVEVDL